MARTGKIARLSWDIRNRLNQRLKENEASDTLLRWLNVQPETVEVLQLHFDGRPISEVNLSAWRKGGYQEWLEEQRSLELLDRLGDQARGAEEAAGGPLSERLVVVLTARLAGLIQKLLPQGDSESPEKQWQYAKELLRELDRVRRSDCRSRRLDVQEEQRKNEDAASGPPARAAEAVESKTASWQETKPSAEPESEGEVTLGKLR